MAQERTRICPAWCVTSAEEHEYDDAGAWLHEGPRFGLLRTWCLDDGQRLVFTATLVDAVSGADELGAEDLRHLATDALDAAMWMDRQGVVPRDRSESVVDLVRRAHERATRSA